MLTLNLPAFNYRIKHEQGKVWIFDGIRKKFVVLTPEEWVRQHLIHYLIHDLRYPRSLIKLEHTMQYNELAKRSDVVVFDRQGSVWMLIECKAPDIALSADVAKQIVTYNKVLDAQYLVVTNGMQLFCVDVTNPEKWLSALPGYQR
jgi:hypothetical protein